MPLLFFSASLELGWSPLEMAMVYEALLVTFDLAIEDNAKFATRAYDPFEGLNATYPAFCDFVASVNASTKRSVDGNKEYLWIEIVRDEIYNPKDKDNQLATAIMLLLIPVFAGAANKTALAG
jgi:hypothetical protein